MNDVFSKSSHEIESGEKLLPERPVLVRLANISKAFGSTQANSAVTFDIRQGDILGLVGGNGAGKSTLMRILCGATRPDQGDIEIAGAPVIPERYSATQAQALGIRIVHQELSLCSSLTVAENFFLEAPEAARLLPGWRKTYKGRARAALDAVFPDNNIDVDREIRSLPIGERQMIEITRAVATPGVRLIILDEPTSSLGQERSRQLRKYIQDRAAQGLSFIFISHKLFEIADVASDVAVLRNGRLVWHGATSDIDVPELVRLIGGEATIEARRISPPTDRSRRKPLVRIAGDRVSSLGHDVELFEGEIVGLAGLEGSGQKELLHDIFTPGHAGSTQVTVDGRAGFVSGDRQREGVFPLWSVLANIGLSRIASQPMFSVLSYNNELALAEPSAKRLKLDPERLRSGILDLSGGNQQKALVARALVAETPIILLDDPTRGVDVASKREFYELSTELAENGKLIVWHSTEDIEFLECDRVLVFVKGRIVRDFSGPDISEQAIVDASFSRLKSASDEVDGMKSAHSRLTPRMLVDSAPFVSLALILAAMMFSNPKMVSVFGLDLLLWSAVPVIFVALAQMFVVGGSEIDLGIGAFIGLINVVSATLLVNSPGLGGLAIAIGICAYSLFGALIQIRKIPAIVVTLGASFVWGGIAYTLQPTPGGASPEWLSALIGWSIPGVPTSLIFIGLSALAAYVLDRTPLGVILRAFGSNPSAMARAGWSAQKYAAIRYAICGFFGTLAGLSLTAINTASDSNAGGSYTLLSVAAVVIGGCSLMGGVISPLGVTAGAVTLALIGALLGMLDVSTDYNLAVQGLLLLAMLSMRSMVTKKADGP